MHYGKCKSGDLKIIIYQSLKSTCSWEHKMYFVGRESNLGQLLGRYVCSSLYHRRFCERCGDAELLPGLREPSQWIQIQKKINSAFCLPSENIPDKNHKDSVTQVELSNRRESTLEFVTGHHWQAWLLFHYWWTLPRKKPLQASPWYHDRC